MDQPAIKWNVWDKTTGVWAFYDAFDSKEKAQQAYGASVILTLLSSHEFEIREVRDERKYCNINGTERCEWPRSCNC